MIPAMIAAAIPPAICLVRRRLLRTRRLRRTGRLVPRLFRLLCASNIGFLTSNPCARSGSWPRRTNCGDALLSSNKGAGAAAAEPMKQAADMISPTASLWVHMRTILCLGDERRAPPTLNASSIISSACQPSLTRVDSDQPPSGMTSS